MAEMQDFGQGWVDDPDAVAVVASSLDYPTFGDTPAAGMADSDLPKEVFLWDAARKILGGLLPPRNQGKVGSCVSFGTNRAVEYTYLSEIARGEPEEYRDFAEEVTYGGSRVEIGNGKIRGDGSIGAWAAKFVSQWGMVDRAIHGSIDLRQYSETRCREYGSTGVPLPLENVAKKYPVKTVTLCKLVENLKKALAQGYAAAVCSSQGFTFARNADGIASPSGSWGHCMCFCGYAEIAGKLYFRIDNSWGSQAHTGPTGPGNPGPEGFYAAADVVQKMLSMGDTWLFSGVEGFPKRDYWFV